MALKCDYIKPFFLTLILLLWGIGSYSQNAADDNDTLAQQTVIQNADTLEYEVLENVWLYGRLTKAQMMERAKYNRLRNAVYVTYPYARRAGVVLNDINAKLAGVEGRGNRKKIIMSREKELRKEFTDPLTNLSVYQGKVLMKLINRESGNNCYEIIKEYKGGLTARAYQTVAFFFSSNLKQPYDPSGEDAVIESIVRDVQRMYGYPEIGKRIASR